jgi:hypothetical protein
VPAACVNYKEKGIGRKGNIRLEGEEEKGKNYKEERIKGKQRMRIEKRYLHGAAKTASTGTRKKIA